MWDKQKREIKIRIQEHRGNIRNYKMNTQTDTPVSRHFVECKHNSMQLKWCILDEALPFRRGGNRLKKTIATRGKMD
ncbi:hypothetical protein XELAEV_18008326mg [Xenopus laevis]|uniref:Uncharacterized protein n=1 Tax=Xenopus laevis TaxID=8355 RepID=A0A974E3I8_XENLA|nr:hypothetical protein XELAEV_18008326mg [Xenopus laevis]